MVDEWDSSIFLCYYTFCLHSFDSSKEMGKIDYNYSFTIFCTYNGINHAAYYLYYQI